MNLAQPKAPRPSTGCGSTAITGQASHAISKYDRRTRRAGSALYDLLVQLLIHDLDGAVDLRIGHAELM
jgi:hypothetical protein